MPAPLGMMLWPLLLAAVAYGVRRWPRVALGVGGVGLTLLAGWALTIELNVPGLIVWRASWAVLGRAFTLEPFDRVALALMCLQTAWLYALAALGQPPRWFVPLTLLIVGLLMAAVLVQPFVFAALFVELASALAVFLLADEQHAATRGAMRFLVFMTLGMCFILLTGWLLESIRLSPGDAALTLRATVLVSIGFAVLLGVAPFHSWMPVVAEHAPVFSTAFVFTTMRFPAAFLLLNFLQAFPWLSQNPAVYRALTLAGGGMVLLGAGFVFGQRRFSRTLGYAMLVDVGAFLLAAGLGTTAGIEAALMVLVMRGLALGVWAAGLDQLRQTLPPSLADEFVAFAGLARQQPFASAALIFGLLSLVGFPLMAGFPARWGLLALLAQIHPTAAILLLAGMASVGLVCARGIAALLQPVTTETEDGVERRSLLRQLFREPPWVIGSLGFVFAVLLLLGAFPQWLLPAIAEAAALLRAP